MRFISKGKVNVFMSILHRYEELQLSRGFHSESHNVIAN